MSAASTEARAAAVAAAMCGASRTSGALARLDGAFGDEARAAHAAWAGLDRAARARAIALAVASVRAPAPLGLALVHASWIEAALAGEGARVRAVVSGAAPAPPEVRAYLERRVLGRFVAMPRAPRSPITPDTLAAAPPAWLEAQLVRAGVHQVAHAAAEQPRAAQAALAVQLGAHGGALIDAIARIREAGEQAASRWGARRATIARVAAASLGSPDGLVALGARVFAPHLDGDAPRQLVQRLPRGLGLRVAAELARPRGAAADAPAWAELISSP